MFEVKMEGLAINSESFVVGVAVVFKEENYVAYVYCDEETTYVQALFKAGEEYEIDPPKEFGKDSSDFYSAVHGIAHTVEQTVAILKAKEMLAH